MYEACKQDPILANYNVDWGVCLHAHYPWVDLLTSRICVMKSYNNDFIACFCSMNDSDQLDSRGFCITKFECLLNNAGVDKSKNAPAEVPSSSSAIPPQLILQLIQVAGQVSHECAGHVQYFLEANSKDVIWFGAAQKKDNLRVRAPYHPESPCRDVHFKGQFDIGQLDVDNIEAGIEVLTPYIHNVYNDPITDWVPPKKQEPYVEPEGVCRPLQVDPRHQERMDILSFFFEERIIADMVIWIPGILFLYSSMFEERSWAMQFLISLVQAVIISIGIYNILISGLPLKLFTNIAEVRQIQGATFLSVFCFTNAFLNSKEATDHFLKMAMICFIPDIVCWKLIAMMYTEDRMFNFKMIYISFLMCVALLTIYSLHKIYLQICQRKQASQYQFNEGQQRMPKKRKNKHMKLVKREHLDKCVTKPTIKKPVKVPAEEEARSPGLTAISTKKAGKNNGSLTSALLDKNTAKVKRSPPRKAAPSVARSNCESWSSCEGDPGPRAATGGKQLPVAAARERGGGSQAVRTGLKPRVLQWPGPGLPSPPAASCPSPPGLSRPDNLHYSNLVDQLVEQNCPETVDQSCKLPQKSKILTIIRENSQTDDFQHDSSVGQIGSPEEADHEGSSGFLLSSKPDLSPGNSLVFVPGLAHSKTTGKPVAESTQDIAPTLDYKFGTQETTGKEPKNENDSKAEPSGCEDAVLESPLVRILTKELAGYSTAALDTAIKEVLLETNIEDLTIPKFRDILVAKLEQEQDWGDGIYISDPESEEEVEEEEEEEEEECHICLDPLDSDLEVVEPCRHVFHTSCISSWVKRREAEEVSATCPKCWAAI